VILQGREHAVALDVHDAGLRRIGLQLVADPGPLGMVRLAVLGRIFDQPPARRIRRSSANATFERN